MEQKFDWKKTIRMNIITLKILGLWPAGDQSYQFNLYTIYTMGVVSFFQITHIILQTVNLFDIFDDLEAVTGTIFVLLMEMMAVLKFYLIIKNMASLKELMIIVNTDLFQPKNFHQRQLIQPNLSNWKFLVGSFWFFSVAWIFFTSSYPIFDNTFKQYQLPCPSWFPYDVKKSPQYEITYIYQVFAISYLCMTNVNVDSLIGALNMYIGAQLDILYDNLINFNEETHLDIVKANKELKHCIHHHKEILKYADKANDFYNWLLFTVFLVGGISIGISMFQLTVISPVSSEFYVFLTYINCITVQVFLYCWFGNEIEFKSNKLPYAIFESNWTALPPEVKQNVIIFIIRLHRTLRISALGLFNLSLDTFVKIMKTAYSYFALLRRVNMVE